MSLAIGAIPASTGRARHVASLTTERGLPSASAPRSAKRKPAADPSFQQKASIRFVPAWSSGARSNDVGWLQSSPWPAPFKLTKRRKWLSALTHAIAFVGAEASVISVVSWNASSGGWCPSATPPQIQRASANFLPSSRGGATAKRSVTPRSGRWCMG
jgi:hypothetical protein